MILLKYRLLTNPKVPAQSDHYNPLNPTGGQTYTFCIRLAQFWAKNRGLVGYDPKTFRQNPFEGVLSTQLPQQPESFSSNGAKKARG